MINLQTVGNYIFTNKGPKELVIILKKVWKIFTFTQERTNRIIRFVRVVGAYKSGKSVKNICLEFGCSNNTVNRYARMSGLPKRPKSDDPERRAKIIKLAKEGKISQKEIASKCNCSVALVSIVEHEAGIARYKNASKTKTTY